MVRVGRYFVVSNEKEYYNYAYIYNGSYRNRRLHHKTPRKTGLLVMNISAGYEIKAGTKNYLRFEPYYKIPLKGRWNRRVYH